VNRIDASMSDTLWLRADAQRARCALDGGGELLVIRLREKREEV
jgi:hypothetical protein